MLIIQVRCKASEAADIVFYFKAFATKQMANYKKYLWILFRPVD